MIPRPDAKKLRDISTTIDPRPLFKSLPALLLAAALAACAGGGDTAPDDTPKPASIKEEAASIFGPPSGAPSWSTNSAAPPPPGEIREIGSVLDSLSFNDLGSQKARKPTLPAAASGPVDKSAEKWTIVLGVFRGENHQQEAGQALSRVQREGRLPQAYLQRRGPSTLVAYGQYAGPTDANAQGDLEKIQALSNAQGAMYPGAYLSPPYQAQAASRMGEYDLRRVPGQYGERALYTLQVGWYGREELARPTEEDLKEARKAAEAAVTRLRQEGELAFYYHGPNRSMVTLGLFGTDDFDPANRPGVESGRLKEARRRHPLSLYNGAGYSYKTPGMRDSKLMPSCLVAIPKK